MIVLLSYIASIIVMMMMIQMTIITTTATSSCTVPTLTLAVKTSVPAFINKKLTKQQQRRMKIQQLQFLKTSTRMTLPTTMSRRSLSATPNEEIVESTSTVISSASPLPGVQQQQQQQHNHQDQSSIDDGTSTVVESSTTSTISTSTTTVTASPPLSTLVSPTTESSLSSSSLFASTSSSSNTAFNFGQSVSIRDRPTTTDGTTTANSTSTTATTTTTSTSSSSSRLDEVDVVTSIRRRNLGVAVTSIGLALSKYLYSYYNPIQPIQLLVDMTVSSPSVSVIGLNGKPTIIDFWAPWCDTCKALAPTIYTIKEQYSSRINFISINGDDPLSYNIVSAFRVDAIPHIAFVSSSGNVQTALIGPVPLSVLQANLDALLLEPTDDDDKIKLPYTMFDAFENSSSRRIRFVDKQ